MEGLRLPRSRAKDAPGVLAYTLRYSVPVAANCNNLHTIKISLKKHFFR